MRFLRIIFISFFVSGLVSFGMSCATAPKSSDAKPVFGPEPGPDPTVTAPPPDVSEQGPQPLPSVYGPKGLEVYPIILVLGPGLARGYAYAGVLRALHDAKIPISHIVGLEMGAVMGGIYTRSKTVNEFEWTLMKLKPEAFSADPDNFERKLTELIGHADFSHTRISFRAGVHSPDNGKFSWLERGDLAKALRLSFFQEGRITRPFPVEDARTLASGPVVVVDVVNEASIAKDETDLAEKHYHRKLAEAKRQDMAEYQRADLVIRPVIKGVKYFDYTQKTKLSFAGKQAVQKAMAELKRLTGVTKP
ncbi:MAG: patatin-like phospholipase family protein [Bacteriovoracia bacterium]